MPGQPLGGSTVVLCRERCTFGEFDAPEGASNSAALGYADSVPFGHHPPVVSEVALGTPPDVRAVPQQEA